MRSIRSSFAPLLAAALSLAPLVGCQSTNQTRVTVLNETSSPVLVDILHKDAAEMVIDSDQLCANASRGFTIANEGVDLQVGIRPIEFQNAPARWAQFPEGGPYLVRVQGSATDLVLVATLDGADDLGASGVKPVYTNRRMNEPPVTPSR